MMHRSSLAPSLQKSALLLLGLAILLTRSASADVNSDVAFSAFNNVDVNALARGQVLQARGGLLDFQRGITAQSLYIIDASPTEVQNKLSSWNPASHPELKVWMHQGLPAHPTAADFGGLQTLPHNSSVDYLVNATEKLDPANPSLQVNPSEAQAIVAMRSQGLDARTLMANSWSQILAGRIGRFLSGNFSADTYTVTGGDINSLSEIKSLLRSDPKVYRQFHPVLVNTPVYGANKAIPASLYYESFDIEGGAALGTGAMYQLATAAPGASTPAAGGPILSADIEYFLNYGIYVSIELEQLSPVDVNGKTETLVWRDDLVSTSNVAYLHGTERLASGMIMLQDVKQAVDAFRAEFK
jgi:hypothetical protein